MSLLSVFYPIISSVGCLVPKYQYLGSNAEHLPLLIKQHGKSFNVLLEHKELKSKCREMIVTWNWHCVASKLTENMVT
jgi:hypothetical protein